MKKYFKTALFLFLSVCFEYSTSAQTPLPAHFNSFDGTQIHYEIQGSGKPILLIHGFTGTLNDWKGKPLADSLLAHGFKLILVDLRGNGLSDKPNTEEAYANNAEVKDLMALMKFLEIEKYDAIGYSRGSIILASLLTKDKNCERAILGGMGADFTDPQWPRRIAFYNALMNDTISGFDDFRKYIKGKALDPLVLACQQKEQPSTSKEALAKLKQDVLVICGDEDQLNGKGSELQLLIPHSKFVEVKGNHYSSAYTVEFAEKALAFLGR